MPRPAHHTPSLRVKRVKGHRYFVAEVRRPDGTRTTISFGPESANNRAADVHVVFGKWLKLFQSNPHKTLSFKNPWDAVASMDAPGSPHTIADLIEHYTRTAERDFKHTSRGEINPHFHRLMLGLRMFEPYKSWPLGSFGPDELRAVQDALVAYRYRGRRRDDGAAASAGSPAEPETPDQALAHAARPLTRDSINQTMEQLRRMFAWAVGRRLMDPAQEQSFREVKPLRRGAAGVTDRARRRPVTQAELDRVVAVVSPEIGDMLRVMWLVPTRPSEVCAMRPIDFLRDDPACWLYIPGRDRQPETGEHKMTHHNQVKAIPITIRLQSILRPRLEAATGDTQPLFSPAKSVAWMLETRWKNRRTPTTHGNRPGTHRKLHPMISASDQYTDQSFCTAVKRGCVRAEVQVFTPYDLRRTTITRVRSLLGKELAAVLTGHSDVRTTDVYLLEEVQEAVRAAKDIDGKLG